ncbi:MAG: hypothetical protein AB2697_12370 [Candidatus Thiodiazotropha endolucinida]
MSQDKKDSDELPDPDEVIRRMLNTPPPKKKKKEKESKDKPA